MFQSMISVYFFTYFSHFFAKPLYKPFGETVFPFPTGASWLGSWVGSWVDEGTTASIVRRNLL
jgi:hypothetical protein